MSITESCLKSNGEKGKEKLAKLEKGLYAAACLAAREAMREQLEAWDAQLVRERDKQAYRHKGKRKTTVKTVFGEVEYERALMETVDEDGQRSRLYLLDEALGKEKGSLLSPTMTEIVTQAACENTFRETARLVSETTGQPISHTAAWKVTQQAGKQARKQEISRPAAKPGVTGSIESRILYEEQDGVWLHLQGADRKKHGHSKEMKVAIAYDGVVEQGKRRTLSHKTAYASFDEVGAFSRHKEHVFAARFNLDEVQVRVLNGDGAGWIRHRMDGDTLYQLDAFHRNKAVREYVSDPDMRAGIFELLYDGKIDDLLAYIEALGNSAEDEREKEKLQTLLTYFTGNRDGLVAVSRRGLPLPPVNAGLEPARLGAMESNIFTLVGNRMKGRRHRWSVKGANNLSALLCLKHTGRLTAVLRERPVGALRPSPVEAAGLSSSKVPLSVGKGWNGFTHAPLPSKEWVKGLLGSRPLSEITIG